MKPQNKKTESPWKTFLAHINFVNNKEREEIIKKTPEEIALYISEHCHYNFEEHGIQRAEGNKFWRNFRRSHIINLRT